MLFLNSFVDLKRSFRGRSATGTTAEMHLAWIFWIASDAHRRAAADSDQDYRIILFTGFLYTPDFYKYRINKFIGF